MATEQTLSIIKPDAVAKNVIGKIYDRFESAGLKVVACKMLQLSEERAKAFYQEHAERPFFPALVAFMTEGPIVVQVLEGDGAIAANRELMGATNLADAAPGTLRADFATDLTRNAVHGSDSPTSAAREIPFFFAEDEVLSR